MPIHDRTYQRYSGTRRRPGGAWRVIARAGLRRTLDDRRFLVLLAAAWMPFVIRLVQMYLAAAFPQAAFLAPTAATLRDFLGQQELFVFLVTVYVGAGRIATDRRTQALPLYLSKPLRPIDYIAGQLAVVLTCLAGVTLVPALLLLVAQGLISGELTLLRTQPQLVPAVTVLALLQALGASTTMLALSSLARGGRSAGMVYTALTMGAAGLAPVVRAVAGDRSAWLGVVDAVGVLGDRLFGLPGTAPAAWPVAVVTLLGTIAVASLVLQRRVRGVEVVA